MPFDTNLAEKVRAALRDLPLEKGDVLAEKNMFGGLCFTLNGKMLMGVAKSDIMVRLETAQFETAFKEGRVRPMDFTGKALANFAYLSEPETESNEELLEWAKKSMAFVREHMLKPAKPTRKSGRGSSRAK